MPRLTGPESLKRIGARQPKPKIGTWAWFRPELGKTPADSHSDVSRFTEEMYKKFHNDGIFDEDDIRNSFRAYKRVRTNVAFLHRKQTRIRLERKLMPFIKGRYEEALREQIRIRLEGMEQQDRKVGNLPPIIILVDKAVERLIEDNNEFIRKMVACRIGGRELDKRIHSVVEESGPTIEAMAELVSSYNFLRSENFACEDVGIASIAARGGLLDPYTTTNPMHDGRFYMTDDHCWLTNLSWMLAHFHKGSQFFICSGISRAHLRRTTKGYEHQVSGFAREIAVALKFGYKMYRTDTGHIVLRHSRPGLLSNLSLLDVAMSEDEFIKHYEGAIDKYNLLVRKRKSQVPLRGIKTTTAKKIKVEGEKGRIADARQEKEQEKTKSRVPASSSASALAAAVSRASSNPTITEREFSRLMLAWAAADAENSGPREAAEMLQKQANNLGYNCQEVAMDGDCFFHAVADQLRRFGKTGQDTNAGVLRNLAAVEIHSNPNVYGKFVPQKERANLARNIAKPGNWVGQIATSLCASISETQ